MTVTFTVPGQPQGKGRARTSVIYGRDKRPVLTKEGRAITVHHTPEKTVAYESLIAHAGHVAMAGRPLMLGPVDVTLAIDVQIPASWSGKKQRMALAGEVFPTTKPDVDNVEKAIFDGLNGVVWKDDVQVVDVRKRKRYAATPGVRVQIIEADQVAQQAVQARLLEPA